MEGKRRHFVLVHGAWCWYKVATLLKTAGHQVTALDMPASGIHPWLIHELHSISDHLESLIEFMISVPQEDRVILAGHSAGGLGISFVMEKLPEKISAGVFAAASMPGPELSFTMEIYGMLEEWIPTWTCNLCLIMVQTILQPHYCL